MCRWIHRIAIAHGLFGSRSARPLTTRHALDSALIGGSCRLHIRGRLFGQYDPPKHRSLASRSTVLFQWMNINRFPSRLHERPSLRLYRDQTATFRRQKTNKKSENNLTMTLINSRASISIYRPVILDCRFRVGYSSWATPFEATIFRSANASTREPTARRSCEQQAPRAGDLRGQRHR